MKQRQASAAIDHLITLGVISAIFVLMVPFYSREGQNQRRVWCQSNLKHMVLAMQQYAHDHDGHLPHEHWVASLAAYTKTDAVFHCPETYTAQHTSDYFGDTHIFARYSTIQSPSTLILLGDGDDNAAPDTTLSQFPTAWLKEESSPAYRHLRAANYAFADGHVKTLEAAEITRDFRLVKP